ncbi:hypothetical protein NDU88_001373 [Pleurodeles waltl]|uniref:Uncharacterized protein n=1 Tax=Pleurodeles waltl TaxID=8319 RepID=A0AAV7Q6X1_PLEWA|nr:hypothetical protein NDU88_001373 [Pleurodeles waltl]
MGLKGQPRSLGARRPRGASNGGARGGAGNPSGPRHRQLRGRPQVGSGARLGGGQVSGKAFGGRGAGRQTKGRVSEGKGPAGLAAAAVNEVERQGGTKVGSLSGGGEQEPWGQGQSHSTGEEGFLEPFEGLGGGELEPVKELSHILEWSDDSNQGGGDGRDQEGKGDGLTFRVRPPVRTYGVFGRGEVAGEEGGSEEGPGFRRRSQGVAVSSLSDIDMEFFQGEQCRSEDGDPGELLAGSEPWEEEEVMAGPSTASWTGRRRDGKAVRAKEVVTQSTTGPGFAPPSGWVSKGKRPGYALQREGDKSPLRRPRIPAAPLEEFIKKARFGSKS